MTLLLDVASAVGDGNGDTMRLTLDFLDHCVDPDIPHSTKAALDFSHVWLAKTCFFAQCMLHKFNHA